MPSCQEITELVTDYLEGKMSLWQRMSFQVHMGMCGHCRRYLKQMKTTIKITGALPQDPIPTDIRDELVHRFRNWTPS